MKTFGSATTTIGRTWLHCGYNIKRFAIGIGVDQLGLSIDIGPFWFSIEW